MSTILDIKAAKAAVTEHQGRHKCSPTMLAAARGEVPCEIRVKLWLAYMDTAQRWAVEPGDALRVTEQYAGQTEQLGKRIPAGAR